MASRHDILMNFDDQEFMFADGYDDAIIGVDDSQTKIVYSVSRCIECLVKEGMTHEEAIDWFSYNTIRANDYMGELRPIFVYDDD